MQNKSQSARAGFWIIACILIVTSSTAYGVYELLAHARHINQTENPLFTAAWTIRHADSVLTNAAQLYAATGDQRYRELYDEMVPKLDAALETSAQLGEPADQELFSNTAAANNRLIDLETRAFNLAANGRTRRASQVLNSPAYQQNKDIFLGAVDTFFARHQRRMEDSLARQQRMTQYLLILLSAAALFGVFAIYLVFRRLGRNIFTPLRSAVLHSRRMSTGDLQTIEVGGYSSEFRDLFASINALNLSFRNAIGGIRESSDNLYESAEALHRDAEEFTRIIQTQSSSTEEISATIQQLTAGSQSISQMTRDQSVELRNLNEIANRIATTNVSLQDFVNDANLQAAEISASVTEGDTHLQHLNESMLGINASTTDITQIISIINGIADRINLLSLNASIEAARAGESGRGFAVVATEISRLADQTAGSIGSIENIIHKNSNLVDEGIQNLKTTTNSLQTIKSGVSQINDQITGIRNTIGESSAGNASIGATAAQAREIAGSIERATAEHKTALQEIVESIENLSRLSQNAAGLIERLDQNARTTNTTADILAEKISFFSLAEQEAPAPAAPRTKLSSRFSFFFARAKSSSP